MQLIRIDEKLDGFYIMQKLKNRIGECKIFKSAYISYRIMALNILADLQWNTENKSRFICCKGPVKVQIYIKTRI